ncbi:hypothetical protein V6N13_083885 [Hibiscus sabdariffa]|uniref:Uncharacterized protein n=1 Tax=Hibiscus sabdariffa TaxID=183260 RepID=A0ABR2SZK9_9ROSI
MATTSSKLLVVAVIQVVIFLSNFQTVTNEPVVSDSPAVLPYVNAPNMSSFFPTEAPPQWPDSEAIAPTPSSSEFAGKSFGCSAKSGGDIVMVVLQLFFLLVTQVGALRLSNIGSSHVAGFLRQESVLPIPSLELNHGISAKALIRVRLVSQSSDNVSHPREAGFTEQL